MAPALLGSVDLRLGSRDTPGAAHVSELQAELRRLQVLQPDEPVSAGEFDDHTDMAVRRFQWFAGQVPGALSAEGRFVVRPLARLVVDGIVGKRTRRLLQTFSDQRWAATGLLVKLNFALLAHTQPNAGFTALLDGNPMTGLCERDFAAVLAKMDAAAQRFGVFVFVNQLFRVEGSLVSGAVVPPASFSSHKIGRAVDLQLGTSAVPAPGQNPQASMQIKNAASGTPFARFRQHAKALLRCRYGGDFDPVDAPHFDRQVLPSGGQAWKMHYFFDQLQYRQAVANADAIPDAVIAAAP